MPKSNRIHSLALVAFLFTLSVPAAFAQEPGQQPAPPPQPAQAAPSDKPAADRPELKKRSAEGQVIVPAGTKLPLILHNSISTRSAKAGDPIYLETLFPVIVEARVVIPAGSFVQGEIVETKRPGRVKGRGEMMLRLNKLILPNAYTVDFNAIPTNAGTGGNETVEGEGKVKGDSDKASDAGTVIKTTGMGAGVGAGVGAIGGNVGRGAGIGTLAGAGVGLASILLTRGPEVELPRGTTLDVELDRPLYLESDKVQFTDPGHPSALAGAPNRQPARTRFP